MIETRAEHLAWCKQRALEYADAGDLHNAFASMASDLSKHEETRNHAGIKAGMILLLAGLLETSDAMRNFIEGIN